MQRGHSGRYSRLCLPHYQSPRWLWFRQADHQVTLMTAYPCGQLSPASLRFLDFLAWLLRPWPSFVLLHAISRMHILSSDPWLGGQRLHRTATARTSSSLYVVDAGLPLSSLEHLGLLL